MLLLILLLPQLFTQPRRGLQVRPGVVEGRIGPQRRGVLTDRLVEQGKRIGFRGLPAGGGLVVRWCARRGLSRVRRRDRAHVRCPGQVVAGPGFNPAHTPQRRFGKPALRRLGVARRVCRHRGVVCRPWVGLSLLPNRCNRQQAQR